MQLWLRTDSPLSKLLAGGPIWLHRRLHGFCLDWYKLANVLRSPASLLYDRRMLLSYMRLGVNDRRAMNSTN